MADEGFHEIQLGKKQLVFAFMAAAVSLVVVFLIGVWVGKDVRRPEGEVVADVPTADVTPETPQPPTQVAASELDYTARLATGAKADSKTEPKPEEITKPTEAPTPAAESGAQETPAQTPPAKPTDTKAATKPTPDTKASTTPAPAAGTFNIQVGAFGTKKPADTLVAKLKKKGYEAYVFTSPNGPSKFRVRVGPYADRPSAEAAAAKLKKEEGLSPLVQR